MDYLAPVPQQGLQNYETYRKTLENRGYVLNSDDTVKKLPPDLLMSDNFMQQQAINKAQEKLKALKMDIAPVNQEIIRTVNPNLPSVNTIKKPEPVMREAVINNTTNITNADNKIINGDSSDAHYYKEFKSTSGHYILFCDKPGNEAITIKDNSGSFILMKNGNIDINAQGTIRLTASRIDLN